jgi:hypothetical protein
LVSARYFVGRKMDDNSTPHTTPIKHRIITRWWRNPIATTSLAVKE